MYKFTIGITRILFFIILLTVYTETAFTATVLLQWNPISGAAGYKVHFGEVPHEYIWNEDVGSDTNYSFTSQPPFNNIYVALSCYDNASPPNESGYSPEIVIRFDRTPPTGTISISDDEAATDSRQVYLMLSATDDESGMGKGAEMMIRNDGEDWTGPFPYNFFTLWTLNEGYGTKRVYVKYKDVAGNWSDEVSDSIEYIDQSQPTGSDPQANATAFPTAGTAPLAVQFYGTGTDPDGDIFIYYWNFGDGEVSFEQNPVHTYDNSGTYTAKLTVVDERIATDEAEVVIQVSESANSGSDGGSSGDSSGGGSGGSGGAEGYSDDDGDGIPNYWERKYGLDPSDDSDALKDNDKDGKSNLEEWRARTNPNDPSDNKPVADAGSDIITAPTMVFLDGSKSSDPNGDCIFCHWKQTDGPKVELKGNSFLGVNAGEYTFSLTVNDGRVSSVPDEVVVKVKNVAPNADAGINQQAVVGVPVRLSGIGCRDANGDNLTYTWNQIDGPHVELSDSDGRDTYFIAEQAGLYTFRLTVTDGELEDSDTVTTVINDPEGETIPVADGGGNQMVVAGSEVVLDGSGSIDSDADELSYFWRQIDGPAVKIDGERKIIAKFVPYKTGIYTFELKVSDGKFESMADRIEIVVNSATNSVPIARIGGELWGIKVGDRVELDGSASFDADGDPLQYAWRQIGGPRVVLSNLDTARPSFYPTQSGLLKFELSVNDGTTQGVVDHIDISVRDDNHPPVADAGEDIITEPGDEVILDGRGSVDDDGDELHYSWKQVKGSPVVLENPLAATTSFIAYERGKYEFELEVDDGKAKASDSVVIIAAMAGGFRLSSPENGTFLEDAPLLVWDRGDCTFFKICASFDGKRFFTIGRTDGDEYQFGRFWKIIREDTSIYWKVKGRYEGTWIETQVWMFTKKGRVDKVEN